MKNNEIRAAINRLKCGNTAHSCKADYIKLAIEALEKQLPKKHIEQIRLLGLDKGGKCPLCHKYINNNRYWAYCDCGQKLDWGEENDDRKSDRKI